MWWNDATSSQWLLIYNGDDDAFNYHLTWMIVSIMQYLSGKLV